MSTAYPEYNPAMRRITVRFDGQTSLNYTDAADKRSGLNPKTIALIDAITLIPSASEAFTEGQGRTDTGVNLIVHLQTRGEIPGDIYSQVLETLRRQLPEVTFA